MVTFLPVAASDTPALKALWLACFEEKPEAVDLFFDRLTAYCHGYKAMDDGAVIAALYLVDCTLNGRQAHYLCGASTRPDYRQRGVMRGLIAYALDDAKRRGDVFSVLCPADEGLYRFYGRLGYLAKCAARTVTLTRQELDAPRAASGTPDVQALQSLCCHKNFLLWNKEYIDFAAAYYGVYGVQAITSADAFALCEKERSTAVIYYAVYRDFQALKSLLQTIEADTYILTGSGSQPLFSGAKRSVSGMIYPLTHENPPDDVFIGITLN